MQTHTRFTNVFYSVLQTSNCADLPSGGSSEVRLQGQSKGQESPGSSPPPSHPISKHCVDPFKPYPDTQIPHPPLLALLHAGEKAAYKNTLQSSKKQLQPQGFQNSHPSPAPRKEAGPGLQNGRSRPWEKFTPEAFAQQFHHAVLQSTHHTLQGNGKALQGGRANRELELCSKDDVVLVPSIRPSLLHAVPFILPPSCYSPDRWLK